MERVGRTKFFALALVACSGVTEGGAPDPAGPAASDAGPPAPASHGPSGHDADAGHVTGASDGGHGHGCVAAGIDGAAPACRLFADCAIGEVEVACDAATETCTCTPSSGAPATIAFDPAFCAVGDGFPQANLAAAARACGWSL